MPTTKLRKSNDSCISKSHTAKNRISLSLKMWSYLLFHSIPWHSGLLYGLLGLFLENNPGNCHRSCHGPLTPPVDMLGQVSHPSSITFTIMQSAQFAMQSTRLTPRFVGTVRAFSRPNRPGPISTLLWEWSNFHGNHSQQSYLRKVWPMPAAHWPYVRGWIGCLMVKWSPWNSLFDVPLPWRFWWKAFLQ